MTFPRCVATLTMLMLSSAATTGHAADAYTCSELKEELASSTERLSYMQNKHIPTDQEIADARHKWMVALDQAETTGNFQPAQFAQVQYQNLLADKTVPQTI